MDIKRNLERTAILALHRRHLLASRSRTDGLRLPPKPTSWTIAPSRSQITSVAGLNTKVQLVRFSTRHSNSRPQTRLATLNSSHKANKPREVRGSQLQSRLGGALMGTKNHVALAGRSVLSTASNAAQRNQAWSTCTLSAAASMQPRSNSLAKRAERSLLTKIEVDKTCKKQFD